MAYLKYIAYIFIYQVLYARYHYLTSRGHYMKKAPPWGKEGIETVWIIVINGLSV